MAVSDRLKISELLERVTPWVAIVPVGVKNKKQNKDNQYYDTRLKPEDGQTTKRLDDAWKPAVELKRVGRQSKRQS